MSGMFALESTWRWMGERAVVLLKPPPHPEPLHLIFTIPDIVPARRVTVALDGLVLEDRTYDKPGSYALVTKPVSGGTLTISVDKTYSAPGDLRKLGIVVSELGFR